MRRSALARMTPAKLTRQENAVVVILQKRDHFAEQPSGDVARAPRGYPCNLRCNKPSLFSGNHELPGENGGDWLCKMHAKSLTGNRCDAELALVAGICEEVPAKDDSNPLYLSLYRCIFVVAQCRWLRISPVPVSIRLQSVNLYSESRYAAEKPQIPTTLHEWNGFPN